MPRSEESSVQSKSIHIITRFRLLLGEVGVGVVREGVGGRKGEEEAKGKLIESNFI